MYYSRLKNKNQVTLPARIIKLLHLITGDTFEIETTPEGNLLLKPQKMVNASDIWFLSDSVQRSLKKSFDDIKNGKIVISPSVDDMIEKLDNGEGL